MVELELRFAVQNVSIADADLRSDPKIGCFRKGILYVGNRENNRAQRAVSKTV